MSKRRIVSTIMVCILIIGTVNGCSQELGNIGSVNNEADIDGLADTAIVDEAIEHAAAVEDSTGYVYTGEAPITKDGGSISILAQTSNYANVDITKAPIVLKVFEEAGVEPNWQLIEYNDYADKATPIISSGETDADIIKIPDSDPNQVYIKSGLFVPLDEFFDYMPNYTAWLFENPIEKAELTAEDGHIYYVPGLNVANDYQPCLMYNNVWLEKAGIEAPKDLDSFVEMLKYFRDNDMNGNGDPDDEIPMSIMGEFLPYMFGPAFGLDLVSGFMADESGKVTYTYADSENYRKYLEFLNGLYEEGLLEENVMSLDRDTVIDRISKDLTGVAFDYSWAMSMMYSNVLPYYDGTEEKAFVGVAPLSGEHEGFYVGRNSLSGMFGVSTKSSQIELAVKFLDFAMSPHCQDYYQWGIEGESYTVNEDGSRSYTEQGNDNDWLQQFGINPAFVFPAAQSVEATDILVAPWHAKINADLRKYIRHPWPEIYATSEESDTVNLYMPDIQAEVTECHNAFITGSMDIDTEFDAYIAKLDKLNLNEVTEVKQSQYNRYLKALE
ncbi:MAG: extracellular solute-binding protein [Lachnospiraceae bacterium]|nr:extracellular solute-binding protein [Lachnospiraceae bacterium]